MKKILAVSIFVILLFGVATYSHAQSTGSGFEYLPFGKTLYFERIPVTGVFDPVSKQISISTRDYASAIYFEESYSALFAGCAPLGNETLYVKYEHGIGTPEFPIDFSQSLENIISISPNGIPYIGEVQNVGAAVFTPEALITKSPVAGETISGYSRVTKSCSNSTVVYPSFHWEYKTIAHYANWGIYTDVWRTYLGEYATSPTAIVVYNYAFARNLGNVDVWWGTYNPSTNAFVGNEYFYSPGLAPTPAP